MALMCLLVLTSPRLLPLHGHAEMVTTCRGELMFNGICLPSPWPPRINLTHKVTTPPYLTAPPAVIDITVGRQLFVDDFLVDSVRSSGLERQWPQPQLQCVRKCYFSE